MQPIYIHHIETAVPPTRYPQEQALAEMLTQFPDKKAQRILRMVYHHSGIEARHTAVPAFGSGDPNALFHRQPDGRWQNPGTGERNQLYTEVSKRMSVELARRTVDQCPSLAASDITHLITASCTGFYNPGPDVQILQALGLRADTERFHLGFMGCYAAFPALRMARQICLANPRAVVMIQCLELCSLHLQLHASHPDALVSGSLFADGAACALVSALPPDPDAPCYTLNATRSLLTGTGEQAMTWDVGNYGYDITLSSYVPDILAANIRQLIDPFLAERGLRSDALPVWAIHPGGRAILDKLRDALELPEQSLEAPRRILREYGNMSSATILFVLKDLLSAQAGPEPLTIPAMAFGPGLTVELALLERHPARCTPAASRPAKEVLSV